MLARRGASSSSLNDRIALLLRRVEYRRAESPDEREAIFRLRYDAYLREGEIGPIASKRFSDSVDDDENTWNFGIYIDGALAGAIRFTVTMPGGAQVPAAAVFEDVLSPEIEAGKTFVDPSKFIANYASSKRYPELPYIILRLPWIAMGYFKADLMLGAVRVEHQPFYKRLWGCRVICAPRPYPGLYTPVCLVTVDYSAVQGQVHRRYPFFQSNFAEQKTLFERTRNAT
jgi:hypothetical protein